MTQDRTRVGAALGHWWRGEGPAIESFLSLLLSIAYAFGFAILLVWLNSPMDENAEWRVFVEGWLLLPPLVLSICLFAHMRSVADREADLSSMVLWQCAALVLSAALLRVATHVPGSEWEFLPATLRAIACFLPIAIATLTLILPSQRLPSFSRSKPVVSLGLLVGAVLLLALPELPSVLRVAVVVAGAALLVWLREVSPRFLQNFASRSDWIATRSADVAIVAIVAWLLFDSHLHFEANHAAWYLGPAQQILQGATMLVDVASAYGVLSIYFLAGLLAIWPLPMSYPMLSAIVLLLVIGQYTTFYVLLRYLRLGIFHASLAIAVVFVANFIGLDAAVSAFPSLGPMRFGLPYLLLIFVAIRGHRPDWEWPCRTAEVGVVAAASLWSLEAAVFTLPAYLAIVVFEAGFDARDKAPSSYEWLQTALRRLGGAALAIVLIHVTFAGSVYFQVERWPDWASYFALVGAYTPGGEGFQLEPIPPLGPWVLILFLYAGSALACVFVAPQTRGSRSATALALVFGTTAMGIAQFSVFIGMSSPYRLASVVMPAVLVGAYWSDRLILFSGLETGSKRAIAFVAYAAVLLTLSQSELKLRDWLEHDSYNSIGSSDLAKWIDGCIEFPECLTDPAPYSPIVETAELLIEEHVGPDQNLAVMLGSISTTEVLMRAGRRNAVALNAPYQDGLVKRNEERVIAAPLRLVDGDVALILTERGEVMRRGDPPQQNVAADRIKRRVYNHLLESFSFRELSGTDKIQAYLLVARQKD